MKQLILNCIRLSMSGKEKLLITGGLGNIGSWLSEYFSSRYDVYILSKNVICLPVHLHMKLKDISQIINKLGKFLK